METVSTPYGAPVYQLLLEQPMQHPWRPAEVYRTIYLIYRKDGHWTIGPSFDIQSGISGSAIFNRGWIRSVKPTKRGALPADGATWSYLDRPRLGRFSNYGK